MKRAFISLAAVVFFAAVYPVHAQLSNMLQGAMGASQGGAGGLGVPGVPTTSAASPTNLAGVLQFCVQNNYLGGGAAGTASSVKDSLLSKVTGSAAPPAANPGFSAGAAGLLNTGNGQSATLGGTGLKAQITQKICDQVLKHASSML